MRITFLDASGAPLLSFNLDDALIGLGDDGCYHIQHPLHDEAFIVGPMHEEAFIEALKGEDVIEIRWRDTSGTENHEMGEDA